MPIANPTDMTSRRQVLTTQIRHDEHLASLIEKALIILGIKKSDFIHNAIAKKAWQERDYAVIVAVANNVLEEAPKLLMLYDQAVTRMGGE